MSDRWKLLPDLLSALEDIELPLLSWGVVDGFLAHDEVVRAIEDRLDQEFMRLGADTPSVDEIITELLDRALLHEVPGSAERRYRTRIAEGLRLLRNLRQLFPPTDMATRNWWSSGAPLVADYRLRIGPRRYPRRNIGAADALAECQDLPGWGPTHDALFAAVIDGRSMSRFQIDAMKAITSGVISTEDSGVVITAGTGSGKTLAFYLPAILDIGSRKKEEQAGVHTVAVYPRNELLRDQAREALGLVLRLSRLPNASNRGLRVGLLYGDTPWRSDHLPGAALRGTWPKRPQGHHCPYFPCPEDGCRGDLLWLDSDRGAGRETLTCSSCGLTIPETHLALTRESMVASPPDILFTTTEMLSRQATHTSLAPLLGWAGLATPRLLLLDEAHTYSGVHGAQVGLLLRRWRRSIQERGVSPTIVGLSATLKAPRDFFSDLTGLGPDTVQVVSPSSDDMDAMNREYAVVLRGDPVSGTSLLSTTIQSAMLAGRLMDPEPGMFGSSGFLFTDDLDVTNRLVDDLHDAEGRLTKRNQTSRPVLAQLRSPDHPLRHDRYLAGQSWDLPAQVRGNLAPLRVSRTSSQDSGVDASSDLVVATASLEVGFNDPRVGLVLQHKAPRDSSAFIQRRGRAGRSLDMRPLTLVVLSDYGRDRIAYQTYEQLLDPEIGFRRLPVGNRFVLKIQAVLSLMDWIYRQTEGKVDPRTTLTAPRDGRAGVLDASAVKEVAGILRELLTDSRRQSSLQRFLQASLGISADEALAVLWEEPRSLLQSVVPTALRRSESAWSTLPGDADPFASPGEFLPEFVTRSLFEPLNTPEVSLALPTGFTSPEDQRMDIGPALREAVPGRVSRRFGFGASDERAWLPIPTNGTTLELGDVLLAWQGQGTWHGNDDTEYFVVRPVRIQLAAPPAEVQTYSNARPVWRSEFRFPPIGLVDMRVPIGSVWAGIVTDVGFGLHLAGSPLVVRRMSIGSEADVATKVGGSVSRISASVRYSHEGAPAALGFELPVDALVITATDPDVTLDRLQIFARSPQWRTRAFRVRVQEDDRLGPAVNVFQREWLINTYLTAHAMQALRGTAPSQLHDALASGAWAADLEQILAIAYRQDHTSGDSNPQRTATDLRALVDQPAIRSVIEEHARLLTLHEPSTFTWDLIVRSFRDTLAAAVLATAMSLVPDAQDGDLIADVLPGEGSAFRIVLSETSVGGLGVLEQLQREYARDPRTFWARVQDSVRPTDHEDADIVLRSVAHNLVRSPGEALALAVERFRRAEKTQDLDEALQEILAAWAGTQGPPSHLQMSTFATRFLRPGSSSKTDSAVEGVMRAWASLEQDCGAEVDSRTVAYAAANGLMGASASALGADAIYSLLWLRGPTAREGALANWQPYADDRIIERLVLEAALGYDVQQVDVVGTDWQEEFRKALTSGVEVDLVVPAADRDYLAIAIAQIAALPIDRGALRVYGRLAGVRWESGFLKGRITIAEEAQ